MDKELYIQIGDRLRLQRKKLGLTQAQAAEKLGISTGYYGSVERGNKRMSVQLILKIYEKMDLEPTYLLAGDMLSAKELSEIFKDCPSDKKENVEQILRGISKLYR